MAAKKRAKKPKTAAGRPSKYDERFDRIAYRHCLLGATDGELAAAFGVSEQTINAWKQQHPGFLESLKKGKAEADTRVADSLFQRALGYKHKAVKILTVAVGDNQGSRIEEVPYVEHYAPDTTAAIFWLKNRRPDQWRDRQQVEHSGSVTLEQMIAASWEPKA